MVDEVRRGAPYLEPEELARIFSVEEFEPLARERMPAEGYNFIAGAAGTGSAARGNIEAYTRWRFRQRGAHRRQPHRHLGDHPRPDDRAADPVRADRPPPIRASRRRAGDRPRRRGSRHDDGHELRGERPVRGRRADGDEAVVPAVLVHGPGADPRPRRSGRVQRLRGHLRDRRHAGAGLARARGTAAAAAVPGHLVRQPPARRRSAARGGGRADLAVARVAPLDHLAADPAQGDHDRGGRATRRRARPGRDHRVEPRRPPARLGAGDARRAARDRRRGRRQAGDPDGRRDPPRHGRAQGAGARGAGRADRTARAVGPRDGRRARDPADGRADPRRAGLGDGPHGRHVRDGRAAVGDRAATSASSAANEPPWA